MLKFLGWRSGLLLGIVATALIVVFVAKWSYNLGAERATAKATAEKLEIAKQTVRLLENSNLVSTQIDDSAVAQREVTNEALYRIRSELAAVNQRLLDRPSRPSDTDLPEAAPVGPALGRTGAELYREDGQFLSGEAARAETLRLYLAECQAGYAKARDTVNSFRGDLLPP